MPTSSPSPATWREIGSSLEHTASGMEFPGSLGDFRRTSVRQNDAEGHDVSVGYDFASAARSIAITVYVYPSPPVRSFGSPPNVVLEAKNILARSEFRRVINEIKQAHPNTREISEKEITAPLSAKLRFGYVGHVAFTSNFAGQTQPVESLAYVYCYVADHWTIKYRITYPAGMDAGPVIDQFIQNLKWTIKEPGQAVQTTLGLRPSVSDL